MWPTPASLVDFWDKTWDVVRCERLTLSLYGSDAARAVFQSFSKPHRIVPFFQNKGFGAALFQLPDRPADYLNGNSFELARRKRRKAQRRGLRTEKYTASDRVDEMLSINLSCPARQGRPVSSEYCDAQAVHEFCDHVGDIYGVFDVNGKLQAYAYAPVLGDVFVLSRLLGHVDELEHGIMYLLITEIVIDMLRVRAADGYPHWAMYDMYWGAKPGLREFKQRLGFKPFRVTWKSGAEHG
jgi:hypothetical protein